VLFHLQTDAGPSRQSGNLSNLESWTSAEPASALPSVGINLRRSALWACVGDVDGRAEHGERVFHSSLFYQSHSRRIIFCRRRAVWRCPAGRSTWRCALGNTGDTGAMWAGLGSLGDVSIATCPLALSPPASFVFITK
jgi:hypothetical protein